jgi:hypothetical protein
LSIAIAAPSSTTAHTSTSTSKFSLSVATSSATSTLGPTESWSANINIDSQSTNAEPISNAFLSQNSSLLIVGLVVTFVTVLLMIMAFILVNSLKFLSYFHTCSI